MRPYGFTSRIIPNAFTVHTVDRRCGAADRQRARRHVPAAYATASRQTAGSRFAARTLTRARGAPPFIAHAHKSRCFRSGRVFRPTASGRTAPCDRRPPSLPVLPVFRLYEPMLPPSSTISDRPPLVDGRPGQSLYALRVFPPLPSPVVSPTRSKR